MAHIQSVGLKFEETFAKYDIDVIVGPSDSELCRFSAARGKQVERVLRFPISSAKVRLGFPIATLPISCLKFSRRPFGLTIAAPAHKEATLIKVMSAWEATFPPRKVPVAFLEAVEQGKRHG